LQSHLVPTGVSGATLILNKQYLELQVQIFLNIKTTRSIPWIWKQQVYWKPPVYK